LALLALFPLGALTMAQAIKDDRTATAVYNATGIAEAHEFRRDQLLVSAAGDVFKDPAANGFPYPAHADLPGYPVYVDPVGFYGYSGVPNGSNWIAATPNTVPRRSVRLVHLDPTGALNSSP